MITQRIKQWLQKLFAWWPWKQTPETNYQPVGSNRNMGLTPETMARTVDGPAPYSGITSVVVEQEKNAAETTSPINEDRVEQDVLLSAEERTPPGHNYHIHTDREPLTAESASPTQEQKLAFLKYLVQKGHFNEGFDKGQTPEQYRKP